MSELNIETFNNPEVPAIKRESLYQPIYRTAGQLSVNQGMSVELRYQSVTGLIKRTLKRRYPGKKFSVQTRTESGCPKLYIVRLA